MNSLFLWLLAYPGLMNGTLFTKKLLLISVLLVKDSATETESERTCVSLSEEKCERSVCFEDRRSRSF